MTLAVEQCVKLQLSPCLLYKSFLNYIVNGTEVLVMTNMSFSDITQKPSGRCLTTGSTLCLRQLVMMGLSSFVMGWCSSKWH